MHHTLIANTRLRVAFVLGLIWVVYLVFNFNLRAFFMPLFSVALVVIFDMLITYIRKKTFYLPASSIVTGFLIGLIISPSESLSAFILATAIAVFSKQFLGGGDHRHIFNPAAFGIFTTSLVLGIPVAWWAVSWNSWIIGIILGVSYTLFTLRRLWLPITFLLVYGGNLFVSTGFQTNMALILDGTVFLFAFIMLPEPITSLAAGKWKYIFGPLVAIFAIALGNIGMLPDVFLPSLLLGNLVGFFAKRLG